MQWSSLSAHGALVGANLLFGVNYSLYVSLVRGVLPYEVLFLVIVLFCALCFLPWVVIRPRLRIDRVDLPRILIPTLLVLFGHQFVVLSAARLTNPADSSTLATLGPVVTLVVSARLFHEKRHWGKVLGVVLGFAGTLLLLFQGGVPRAESAELGNLLMVVSVVAASTNTVFIKPALVRYGTMTITGWYYLIGVVLATPLFGAQLLAFDFAGLTSAQFVELGVLLCFGTMLPFLLLYYGTERLSSVHTGLYAYLQPIGATLLGLWRGQVELTRGDLIAYGLILLGVLLVVGVYVRYKFPAPPPPPAPSSVPPTT